jgi:hypothetical protein
MLETMPHLLRRHRVRASRGRAVMSWPSMTSRPAVARSGGCCTRTRVDLPLPDRPMMTMISPSCTEKGDIGHADSLSGLGQNVFFRAAAAEHIQCFSGSVPENLHQIFDGDFIHAKLIFFEKY